MVLALHYFADLSVAEIAAELGLPPGTVKTRLMRGREALQQHLGRRTADPPPRRRAMADRELRDAARAVERSVVASGLRRRRHPRSRRSVSVAAGGRVGALSAAAVVLVGVAVALPWSRLGTVAGAAAPADPPRRTDGAAAGAGPLGPGTPVADEDATCA